MAVLFGAKQFNRPTPVNLNNIIQVYTVIAAVILSWIGTSAAAFIPLKDSGIIPKYFRAYDRHSKWHKAIFWCINNSNKCSY